MSQIKVVVTGRRSTAYQRAHRTAEVLYTDRVAELVRAGVLTLVRSTGVVYVDADDKPVTIVTAPARAELVAEAEAAGVVVKPSWPKARLVEEIARTQSTAAAVIVPTVEVEPAVDDTPGLGLPTEGPNKTGAESAPMRIVLDDDFGGATGVRE